MTWIQYAYGLVSSVSEIFCSEMVFRYYFLVKSKIPEIPEFGLASGIFEISDFSIREK